MPELQTISFIVAPIITYAIEKPGATPLDAKTWYVEVQDGKIVGTPPSLKAMLGWTGAELMNYLRPRGMTCEKMPF